VAQERTVIVLASDFAACSDRATIAASALAVRFKAELHLLHVVQGREHDDLAAVTRRLDDLRRLIAPGLQPIIKILASGTPATAIVEHARHGHADLIVVGSHERTGLQHLLHGSVAEAVMRQASCPVLTVRAATAIVTPAHGQRPCMMCAAPGAGPICARCSELLTAKASAANGPGRHVRPTP
jgi:nucleotide-binding universal stress UspA family protein